MAMRMPFTVELLPEAKNDCRFWKRHNPSIANKIKALLKGLERDPFSGIGKPEPLKHDFRGLWSRRITEEHRMLYEVKGDLVIVYRCRWHYS